MYGCDGAWWQASGGVPEFKGLKLSQDSGTCARYHDVHHVTVREQECNDILVDEPGCIGAGGNSGFQALNLAVQFGATRVVLVGFDMRTDRGVHWHGNHGKGLNNPSLQNIMKWRRTFVRAAPVLAGLGVDVVNISPDSALMAFPRMSIEETLCL